MPVKADKEKTMPIRKWHFGKLIILWAWGVVCSALAITDFVSSKIADAPILRAIELIFVVLVPLALSIITWYWLGAKDSR